MRTRDEFIAELQSNLAVKESLAHSGDNELQPRDVMFQLISDSKEQLEEAVKHARMFAYTLQRPIAEQNGSNGPSRYSAQLSACTSTKVPILLRHCAVMLAIADAFGCRFNGWEAKVVREGGNGDCDRLDDAAATTPK